MIQQVQIISIPITQSTRFHTSSTMAVNNTTCDSCHNQPMLPEVSNNTCGSCHSPSIRPWGLTDFPHHNITNPAGNFSCGYSVCHNTTDIRYIEYPYIVEGESHIMWIYCDSCHEEASNDCMYCHSFGSSISNSIKSNKVTISFVFGTIFAFLTSSIAIILGKNIFF